MIAENVQGGTTMSDGILSALDNLGSVFLGDSRDDDFQGGNFVRLRDVKAVVAEALTNPTDEEVDVIDQVWRDYHYSIYDTITGQLKCACGEPKQDDLHRIRVYLAAAAGDDQ